MVVLSAPQPSEARRAADSAFRAKIALQPSEAT